MSSPKVQNSSGTTSQSKNIQDKRPIEYKVKQGDTLQSIAKKFNMTVDQLKILTGVKTLKAGDTLKFKSEEVPAHKGIMALANKYNMDFEAFCKLNNIPKPYREYSVSAGEKFYIIKDLGKSAPVQSTPAPQPAKANNDSATHNNTRPSKNTEAKKSKAHSKPAAGQVQTQAQKNKTKYGSSYTPSELAQNIYQKSCDYYGAVGKPDFDALIDEINPKNVIEVLEEYKKNPKNKDKESLINTLTSEVNSNKENRKKAVMKIYDALAQRLGTPKSVRDGFKKELDEQFDSWGMVSTKKLDETIARMQATPAQLAAKMEHDIDSETAAVGKPSFNELLALVNSKNVEQVIKEYDKLNTNESLIEGITSEVRSSKKDRKVAVMHIYDELAKAKNPPAEKRKEFEKELNAQFDKLVGMVNTEKLDAMIKEIMEMKTPSSSSTSSSSSASTTPISNNKNKVIVSKTGKEFTVSELQKGAINSAKEEAKRKFKEYCKQNGIKYDENMLDLAPMNRIPEPVIKNNKIVAKESEVLRPTGKPNGKVVVLNPGHGGYSSRTGYFDTGAYSFIKKGNGKYAPLLEYEKMKSYAEDTADKLRAEGYTVVIMNAHSETISDNKSVSNLIQRLNTGAKDNKKYKKEDIVFVSIHADSDPGKSGTGVCYDSRFSNDTKLAQTFNSSLNADDWIKCSMSERVWGNGGIQVLHQSEDVPSVLLEVEYVNGSKCQNLDSRNFQTRFENQIVKGLNEYFGI